MDLVVNGYGAVLRKKQNRFLVDCDGEVSEISSEDLDQIFVCDSAMISTNAIAFASAKGIDVVVISRNGMPLCRVLPTSFGKTAQIRRKQIEASKNKEGFDISRAIIWAKLQNMSNLIAALARTRNSMALENASDSIDEYSRNALETRYTDGYERLRGIEGAASSLYYQLLGDVLPRTVYRGTRSQHPAADVFNSYLNYCYGILYNEIETACIYAGLDPWVGFMHADRAGHKSFVYDCIEQFRQPVVDRLVITMAVRKRLSPEDMNGSFLLTNSGRRKAIGELISRLDEVRVISGKKTTFKKEIRENIMSIARSLTESTEYRPFVYRWAG